MKTLLLTEVFVNQKSMNVHEHKIKMVSCDSGVRATNEGIVRRDEWRV